ncbi:MAG: Hsp70 family protein, partial [Desulfovibrio sp.]|nr:Hsp70 family protein [Desulfovibrio sp.]
DIAREAGFGNVETLPEPEGALYSDLGMNQKKITRAAARAGYLVIDFGGGTCDFALMQNGRIAASWGDMNFGGRLFDDLFYQWFAEQNKAEAERGERIDGGFYTMTKLCREVKEEFSNVLNDDPTSNIGVQAVGTDGAKIRDLNKENFLRRARAYRPSATFIKTYQEKMNQQLPEKLTNGETIDLIAWFENCLEDGLREAGKTWQNIKVVSLAGGGSLWFFVKEYLEKKMGNESVSRHPSPMTAIANGIALSVRLKKKFNSSIEEIEKNYPKFIEAKIEPYLDEEFNRCIEMLADRTVAILFDENIKPIMIKFRENGGSIDDLKKEISAATERCKTQIEKEAQIVVKENIHPSFDIFREKLQNWLNENYDINLPDADDIIYEVGENNFTTDDLLDGQMTGVGAGIGIAIALIIQGILLFAGPVGWIIRIIAGVGSFVGGFALTDKLPLPSWGLKRALKDEKISEMRENMHADFYWKFAASLAGFLPAKASWEADGEDFPFTDEEMADLEKLCEGNCYSQMLNVIDTAIDAEIKRLDAVDML